MSQQETSGWPLEPVLEMGDIQGIAVPGFFKPYQTLLGVRYERTPGSVARLKAFLRELTPSLASASTTLVDRRGHRDAGAMDKRTWPPLIAIGLSWIGLSGLTPGATMMPSLAFKNGLARRSAFLGDPTRPEDPGHPSNWLVGGPDRELDILIVVAGDDRPGVDAVATHVKEGLARIGLDAITQNGDVREDARGHEHFGFDDGVSQPGIRGRASSDPADFITDRHVDRSEFPAAALYGYPGQDLVWPGEFVIGYPRTGADPLIPGPELSPSPPWTRNGSFLVYRRLRQDVGLFWRTMKAEAERLAKLPGFGGLDDVALASKLVGRWPSGAPISRTPVEDKALGDNQLANNHFRFDSDTPRLKLTDGDDAFASAGTDPIGMVCPLGAHIRKVNTRDSPSDTGARSSTYERRILRVGVPYGPSVTDRYAEAGPDDPDRGLLFLSIQSSIEDQFEFLQARWINDDSRPKSPSGHDMLVGQNTPTADGVRRCLLIGPGFQQVVVQSTDQFVTPTGGGYFFVPSLSALRTVLAAH